MALRPRCSEPPALAPLVPPPAPCAASAVAGLEIPRHARTRERGQVGLERTRTHHVVGTRPKGLVPARALERVPPRRSTPPAPAAPPTSTAGKGYGHLEGDRHSLNWKPPKREHAPMTSWSQHDIVSAAARARPHTRARARACRRRRRRLCPRRRRNSAADGSAGDPAREAHWQTLAYWLFT